MGDQRQSSAIPVMRYGADSIDHYFNCSIMEGIDSPVMRWDIINWLIQKKGYNRYLEIGVNKRMCYDKVVCKRKECVDPNVDADYRMTSDAFFEHVRSTDFLRWDVIFIDGLHHWEQVDQDIYNSLRCLNPGGIILLHDCNPPSYESQIVPRPEGQKIWTGDTWKTLIKFRIHNHQCYYVGCIDTDFGIGYIIPKGRYIAPKGRVAQALFSTYLDIGYEAFSYNRKTLLNLESWEDFKRQVEIGNYLPS